MSRENVDLVRAVYDAVARRDSSAVLALYDPGAELDFSRSPFVTLVNRSAYRGHGEIRSFFREQQDAWKDIHDTLEELVDAGERVVSVVTTQGRGRTSGAEVRRTHAGVWTIRDGKIVRVVWFPSREEALEAMGLSE